MDNGKANDADSLGHTQKKDQLRVYFESSLFGFHYHDYSPEHKQDVIDIFNLAKSGKITGFTSDYVTDEIKTCKEPRRAKLLDLIDEHNIEILPIDKYAIRIAQIYIAKGIFKEKYKTDAIHVAFAAVRKMDIIVSLNFDHIARETVAEKTSIINKENSLKQTRIYTPRQLKLVYEHLGKKMQNGEILTAQNLPMPKKKQENTTMPQQTQMTQQPKIKSETNNPEQTNKAKHTTERIEHER